MVSVIIPCFNAAPWIREALNSVLTQGLENLEIIVIDDGSTDESVKIIEKEFPSVQLIKIENQGPAKARNIGTNLSRGEFIQYLDADDLIAPGKLKIQLETLEKSGADIAYGDWQKLMKTKDGKYMKGETVKRKIKNPEIELFTANFWCPPAVYLFRRSIVEKVGNWQEDLPINEDVRFMLDCVFQGATFAYCEGIMAYHRIHPGESTSTRNSMLFIRCCLKNAIEIEKRWQEHGGINEERRDALLRVYGYVARESLKKDKMAFESAYRALNRVSPGFIPEKSKALRILSILLGYKKAEEISFWYREIKNLLRIK